jgi:hypothetical protein
LFYIENKEYLLLFLSKSKLSNHTYKTTKLIKVFTSPYAIWNRKLSKLALETLAGTGAQEQATYEDIIKKYPSYKFLYYAQYGARLTLSSSDLDAIDQAQKTKLTPLFVALILQGNTTIQIL